jgi:hypothetical protein
MSFSFGFSGDDVGDDNDVVEQTGNAPAQAEAQSKFVGLPAEEHSLDTLVGLPVAILSNLLDTSWLVYDGSNIFKT